jgi:mRNA interferase YafQ
MTNKYTIEVSAVFKKCRRRLVKRGYDMKRLEKTIDLLASGNPMPANFQDHALHGKYKGCRECHVDGAGDWLLIYVIKESRLILLLSETGTHADLFE